MNIKNSTVLVTGSNRGIGKAFVQALLDLGAYKVYAGARHIDQIVKHSNVVPVELDVTNSDHIARIKNSCPDINLLINNAGILKSDGTIESARLEMEVNYFGPLSLIKELSPLLANGGIINVVSVAAWLSMPSIDTYSASKAAMWSMTNSMRSTLITNNTQVMGVYMGFVNTDMSADFPDKANMLDPLDLAYSTLRAFENGQSEYLADSIAIQARPMAVQ
jgi:NAD(P)-dependent dehydrogenase (short-subunit alcohol dehydrogenase family)